MLKSHKETLQSIAIHGLESYDPINFDLHDFERLEYLSLTPAVAFPETTLWDDDQSPKVAIPFQNFLGPQLRVFNWNFTRGEFVQREDLGNFSEKEEAWLRALVAEAVVRQCSLKTIDITFNPQVGWFENLDDNTLSVDKSKYFMGLSYPWDRMDAMAADFYSNHGIKLTYSPPTVSRERFLRFVRHHERRYRYYEWVSSGDRRCQCSECGEEDQDCCSSDSDYEIS
jgi:hypothetical protein